jgi:hypothetical protein
VSGFLLTGQLVRAAQRGDLDVRRRWSRTLMRLTPAAVLVLAVTTVASAVVLSAGRWAQTLREIAASALYLENWLLVADSADYAARNNMTSVVQHFWSLSIQGQVFLVWPPLIALVALASRGAPDQLRRERPSYCSGSSPAAGRQTGPLHRRHLLRAVPVALAGADPLPGGGASAPVLMQVADEADDVVGDESSDGAAGVDADDDGSAWVEDEPGGLQVQRIVVDERSGRLADGAGVGAVADGEVQAELVDEGPGGGLVVGGERDDPGVDLGQTLIGALEGAQLGVAVPAPRAAIEEHDAVVPGQGIGQLEGRTAGEPDGQGGELVTDTEYGHGLLLFWGVIGDGPGPAGCCGAQQRDQ